MFPSWPCCILTCPRTIIPSQISLVFAAMLLRRNWTTPNPGYASSHPTNDSFRSRRPPDLVTGPNVFPPTMPQTVETESPKSEISPQDTPGAPPMSPRPSPSPLLQPRNAGLRQRPTSREAHAAFNPTLNFPSQPQQSNAVPMHSVGGSEGPSSSPYGSGRGVPYHNTANYTSRSDEIPPPHSDFKWSYYDPADISDEIHANVWSIYNIISKEADEKMLFKWSTDLDSLLIFVSLIIRGCR